MAASLDLYRMHLHRQPNANTKLDLRCHIVDGNFFRLGLAFQFSYSVAGAGKGLGGGGGGRGRGGGGGSITYWQK